ncbi:DNA-3-methyladenine glycosylase I [Pseudoruegeria sp. SHC-113]|uniref:DNA-3-methyladenine glycosylase I n=1 Tax=Pseudoruegeria sp. SHC-113 TaxID=2855439 RepID=UPI0021BA56EE|nr:DNA-3-methyladenine glycosylase I [Pseudoruegeria sp. SHC-113]MCT8158504.1 DNA-3-methyladenine glycosylase I [Pseudoruegeria sp. SHC-113]
MRTFDEILEISGNRHGGVQAVVAQLTPPKSPAELAQIGDDRWLSQMTKAVFQAGFSWKVIEAKWPGFETAFKGFDPGACAMMDDAWFDSLLTDTAIVRNGTKIRTVQENAVFLLDLARGHGSAARCFADWPSEDYIGLLALIKKEGSRLGGTSGQYMLRMMGKESFILSRDVVARLIAEGVIDKPPTSKKALVAVQEAFNGWKAESGRSLTEISRVLAMSCG